MAMKAMKESLNAQLAGIPRPVTSADLFALVDKTTLRLNLPTYGQRVIQAPQPRAIQQQIAKEQPTMSRRDDDDDDDNDDDESGDSGGDNSTADYFDGETVESIGGDDDDEQDDDDDEGIDQDAREEIDDDPQQQDAFDNDDDDAPPAQRQQQANGGKVSGKGGARRSNASGGDGDSVTATQQQPPTTKPPQKTGRRAGKTTQTHEKTQAQGSLANYKALISKPGQKAKLAVACQSLAVVIVDDLFSGTPSSKTAKSMYAALRVVSTSAKDMPKGSYHHLASWPMLADGIVEVQTRIDVSVTRAEAVEPRIREFRTTHLAGAMSIEQLAETIPAGTETQPVRCELLAAMFPRKDTTLLLIKGLAPAGGGRVAETRHNTRIHAKFVGLVEALVEIQTFPACFNTMCRTRLPQKKTIKGGKTPLNDALDIVVFSDPATNSLKNQYAKKIEGMTKTVLGSPDAIKKVQKTAIVTTTANGTTTATGDDGDMEFEEPDGGDEDDDNQDENGDVANPDAEDNW